MNDRLTTYLQDHLAGATFGVNLLRSLREQHAGDAFSDVIAELLADVEADEATLRELVNSSGGGDTLKEATAWFAERASRLKLRFGVDQELGTFEGLELMSLGVLGKRALWRALEQLKGQEPRLAALDLPRLIARAESQFDRLEHYRLAIAPVALGGDK